MFLEKRWRVSHTNTQQSHFIGLLLSHPPFHSHPLNLQSSDSTEPLDYPEYDLLLYFETSPLQQNNCTELCYYDLFNIKIYSSIIILLYCVCIIYSIIHIRCNTVLNNSILLYVYSLSMAPLDSIFVYSLYVHNNICTSFVSHLPIWSTVSYLMMYDNIYSFLQHYF